MTSKLFSRVALVVVLLTATVSLVNAQDSDKDKGTKLSDASCRHLPGYAELKAAIEKATADETSGLNNHMWPPSWTAMA